MKKFLHVALVLLLAATTAQAGNKYLQQFENYFVMSMGGNVLRFTIPIWVCGEGDDNTYYLRAYPGSDNNTKNSYLWYSETNDDTRDSATVHRIASFGGPGRANYNGRKSGGVGYAYLLVGDGAGGDVQLQFYSPELKRIFEATETFPFRNDDHLGTVAQPYIPQWREKTE